MHFDTVLFDLDDTILDRDLSFRACMELFISKYAVTWKEDDLLILKTAFVELDMHGYRPRRAFFSELDKVFPDKLQLDLEEFIEFWNVEFPKCAEPMPGLYDVLNHFADRKIHMGLVTNGTSRMQNAKIDKLGIRKHMKSIIISEEADIKKPDPEIFRLALTEMCAVGATALFVGDNPIADMQGASMAGLTPVWLSRGQVWSIESFKPDWIIESLSELISNS